MSRAKKKEKIINALKSKAEDKRVAMQPVCIVVRGISGSGKSTYAKALAEYITRHTEGRVGVAIHNTDDFFIDGDGVYRFDPRHLGMAHNWNLCRFIQSIEESTPFIIVENTFTQIWEFSPYVGIARMQNYQVGIHTMHCEGPVSLPGEAKLCHARNVHNVPFHAVEAQWKRWETHPQETPYDIEVVEEYFDSLV